MYRGQDIGDRDALASYCVRALESGQLKPLYGILPHISVLRLSRFLGPLIQLLEEGTRAQKLFAALALGSIASPQSVLPLSRIFDDPETYRGAGTRSLQKAAILSLGEIGHADCIHPLLVIYRLNRRNDKFQSRRKQLVITALGTLVQNGNSEAQKELVKFLSEQTVKVRAQAVVELGVAYWHCPAKAPDSLLMKFRKMTQDQSAQVRDAAHAALLNLADLGCERAEQHLREAIHKQTEQRSSSQQ